ncbi:MAG: MBL fold metallo-hydrolase [Bifidobacteriaceae bacterium]|jgi:competence protein ComEC|nr:MBL fold metallo-hydrolase [Bifidobacteriaceae bacterium]
MKNYFIKIIALITMLPIILSYSLSILYSHAAQYLTGNTDNWVIANCDVWQGDSFLIRTGENSAIVNDVGPEDDGKHKRDGIVKCLKKYHINQIDLLILSHYHDDHVGDLESLLKVQTPAKILLPIYEEPAMWASKTAAIIRKYAASTPVTSAITGQNEIIGFTKFTILNANPLISIDDDDSINDSSLTVYYEINAPSDSFESKPISFLATGDIEIRGQQELLKTVKQLNIKNIDIYKIPHHGSSTQNATLLKILNPKIALIGVGEGNSYKHPSDKTIALLESINPAIIIKRTDQDGSCAI